VDRQQFVRHLLASIEPGESQAAGMGSPGSFYLDVGALTRVTEGKVLNLLSATSAALQKGEYPANTKAALDVAHNILVE
jgi:hypothetical protein